jgi:hypothetical protein
MAPQAYLRAAIFTQSISPLVGGLGEGSLKLRASVAYA